MTGNGGADRLPGTENMFVMENNMKIQPPFLIMLLIFTLLFSACRPTNSTAEKAPRPTLPPPDPNDTPIPTIEPTMTPTEVHLPWPPIDEFPWPQDAIAPWPTNEWSISSPEAQGIDSEALLEMLAFLKGPKAPFHSLLLVRNGYLVLDVYWDPYTGTKHSIFSSTKSVVSALTGIAKKDGYFQDVNQPVADLFPDLDLDNLDEKVTSVSIRDVLTMTDGMDWSETHPQTFLEGTLENAPGTYFKYDNQGPNLMTSAIQSLSGQDPLDFAQARLFGPLGISEEDVTWNQIGSDERDGGSGLKMRPLDMAKIGYLYLNNGMWDGKEILTKDWIEQSIYPHIIENLSAPTSPPVDGYGYFWWVNRKMGFYGAFGFGGQLIVVFPGKNMILVTTGDARSSSTTQYAALTNFIVPLQVSESPLPENPTAIADLEALIAEFGGN